MRLDHVRDVLGAAELAHDAARLHRVVISRDRLERAIPFGELDDPRRVVDVCHGAERIEIHLLLPELAIHRDQRLEEPHHADDVLHEVAVDRDRHARMQRDVFDVAPLRVAV